MATLTTTPTTTAELTETENGSESHTGEREMLTEDEIFHVLQNERRRLVLRYLDECDDDVVRMGDMAEQVSAWEHDTTVQALTSTQRQRVYIPLYQNHLTKLDDLEIIEYNQSRGLVERGPRVGQLQAYLEPFGDGTDTDDDAEDAGEQFPWAVPYLGVSALGAGLLTARAWGWSLLATAPDFAVGAVILLLFSALSAAQLLNE